jgi:hypothetical protein
MANFAVIKDNVIENVILADTLEIAQEVTGLECIETNGSPWTNWTRSGDTWIAPTEEPTND